MEKKIMMSMNIRMAVAVVSSVLTVVGLTAPASAAPPWVITVGTQSTGQVPFSAYTKTGINFTVLNGSSVVPMSCGSAAAAGVIYPGTYPNGLAFGRIDGSAWSNCIGPGLEFNVSQVMGNKRILNLTGVAGPTWSGYINNINARVEAKISPSICSFNLTGRMNMEFNTAQVAGNNNYTQTLTFNQTTATANLLVGGVLGCFGLIANGNRAGFQGSFKVYNSAGLINVA